MDHPSNLENGDEYIDFPVGEPWQSSQPKSVSEPIIGDSTTHEQRRNTIVFFGIFLIILLILLLGTKGVLYIISR